MTTDKNGVNTINLLFHHSTEQHKFLFLIRHATLLQFLPISKASQLLPNLIQKGKKCVLELK